MLLAGNLRAAESVAQRFDFNLPAERLELALQRFTAQSGASAGTAGRMPEVRTREVSGRYTALEALRRMLAGSGLEVVPVDGLSFRLQYATAAPVAPVADAAPLAELAEVVVTAAKRRQALFDLPLPLTVVDAGRIEGAAPLGGSRAALDFDAATTSTNLGPGRNRHFIRGVADSAFLGPSQATVSMQFDEARLNYNAPDPDLRLLDVERVEILKGPQGPLYGTGALGGVVHILPRRPQLDEAALRVALSAGDTAHGGLSSGAAVVWNQPLRPGVLGLRAVAYAADEAGWIDNIGAHADANRNRLAGGRLALRGRLADWLLDVQGAAQLGHTLDSQYVPGPVSTLGREGVLREPRDNDIYLASAVLRGPLWGGELVFTSSYVRQEVDGIQDASAAASAFGATAPLRYVDDRGYHLLGNELRLSGGHEAGIGWLVGASHLAARSRIAGHLDPPSATVLDLHHETSDVALFGEVILPLAPGLRMTTGLRLARVADEDERREAAQSALVAAAVHSATPSIALDWHAADGRRIVFLRFAQAVRPGGLNPDGSDAANLRFRADELSNLDAGLRLLLAGDAVTLQSTVFATRWRHVQSDYLQGNGLIGTRNVGDAGNLGLEAQLRVEQAGGWSTELGALLQHARLEEGAVVTVAREDPRLPVVPDVRLYGVLARDFPLGGWRARVQARAEYTGSSRLSFDADLDRRTRGSFALGGGARLARGGFEVQLDAANLLDSRADTFAFGNPFSIRDAPQRTPRQPRSVTLQLAYSW